MEPPTLPNSDDSAELGIMPLNEDLPHGAQEHPGREGLLSRSYLGLLMTQFLGAMNDNIFRWLCVWIGKDLAPEGYESITVSLGLSMLVLPFILWAGPAGYLADRFSKRDVIVWCKVAEVLLMIAGVFAILSGSIFAMFSILFLMGSQSAMFGPAKYSAIPEIVRPTRISAANGLVAMTTIVGIVGGTIIASYLYIWTEPLGQERSWLTMAALVGVAGVGLLTSLLIRRLPIANPTRRVPWNLAGEAVRDLRVLWSNRPLLLAALGSALFWGLAGLFQVNVDKFATEGLGLTPTGVALLLAVLACGVASGNIAAGWISGSRIELGLVPFAAAGIVIAAILLAVLPIGVVPAGGVAFFSPAYLISAACLFALGIGAGIYDVPLQSFLQYRSPVASRGTIMAASNLLTFSGMLVASGVFAVLGSFLSGRMIFLVSGLALVPAVVIMVLVIPRETVRFLVWMVTRLMYRVKVEGLENVPAHGGVLLAPNHISWMDGLLIGLASPRHPHYMAYAAYFEIPLIAWFGRLGGVIPVWPGKKSSVVGAIRAARETLARGDIVAIFPEGGLSRTGDLRRFEPGFLAVLKGTNCPVVPVHISGLWGSIFSFEGGRFFWKIPRGWPRTVTIRFGKPIHRAESPKQVRQAVLELGADPMAAERRRDMNLARRFLRMCRSARWREKVVDSTGVHLRGGSLLTRTLILRRLLRREVLADDERYVGLLLPPSAGAVVANAALAIDRRISANLNYTLSSEVLNACIARCGIRHVLTSRRVMERLNLQIDAELVYLEDFREKVTLADKLLCLASAQLEPVWSLERRLGLTGIDPDDLLTVIFTSGSTGLPKGVMLSFGNIGSNIDSVQRVLHLHRNDVLMGILPFFHSFGYTATLWTMLTLEPKAVYHYSPLEARQMGKLCQEHGATILVGSPTFLRSYTRRCTPEEFATLDVVVAGSEKLPKEVSDGFEQKFGVRPIEGYGTTELSPVVSANIPRSRAVTPGDTGVKEGTVGRALPGIRAKVVDLETGEDLGENKSGMLLITGPNVMKGYLEEPEKTAEVLRDGWYVTGDVATIDAEGYITITGRESRFAKIGGEMVPHLRIEEMIGKVLSDSLLDHSADEDDGPDRQFVVTSVADLRKGERLVVLHTGLPRTPDEICHALAETDLPRLWIPSPDSFRQVAEIPVLGTGKLDLRAVREQAESAFLAASDA
ncbi:MAG: acyl-[ACP]--phospholipid O-acyltransferase [Patescibacteria group bacterium]|nr:acyl-[ACP]--phospholipid O-acyltransferase [Patescibacteria group bacterium]